MVLPSRSDIEALQKSIEDVQAYVDIVSERVEGILAHWDISPAPDSGITLLRKACHRYWGSGPTPAADLYDLQDSQWLDLSAFSQSAKKFRYVTTAYSPDARGDRQFIIPGQSAPYRAKYKSSLISRPVNSDVLLNIASSAYRSLAVANIKNIVTGFDGLYMDEVDDTWINGYPSFPVSSDWDGLTGWRNAMVLFVQQISTELHSLNKKLWINLGSGKSLDDPWKKTIVSAADAVNVEYFIGKDKLGLSPDQNSDWLNRIDDLAAIEQLGKPVHVHCSSFAPWLIDYAFLSWLMGTQFLGSFTASVDYTGDVFLPSGGLWLSASKLGRPMAPMGTSSIGYVRRFEHGVVYVNPFSDVRAGLPSMTGKIQLT